MLDLYNKQYDRETLKKHIYSEKLIDIVKTQNLDISFIVKYILNEKYQLCEDDKISIDIVLKYQKHISKRQIIHLLNFYDSDNDSILNFDV